MPLHLQNDFTPHIRWLAQTSTWKLSTPDGPEPITWEHAIFDLANIQTGWAIFAEGQAPEWVMDPSLEKQAPKPQDGREWRRGFKVSVFSESVFGGVREFATTAVGAVRGILELYGKFEAEVGQHFNQVPVVQYTGATSARIGKGNTNIPNFTIVKWTDRPDALPFKDDLPEKPAYTDHQAPLAPARPQRADYVNPAGPSNNLDPDDSIDL
jgi:hypothetical protein